MAGRTPTGSDRDISSERVRPGTDGPNIEAAEQPKIQHFDMPPVIREKRVEIPKIEQREQVIEVPHVEYIERIEEVTTQKIQKKIVQVPKIEVTERIIEIPKHVKEEQIVEVPQLQVIDKVIEVPQYIIQQKLVEVPKIMLQILRERVRPPVPPATYGRQPPYPYPHVDDSIYDEPVFDKAGKPVLGSDGTQLIRRRRPQIAGEPMEEFPSGKRAVDEVVEIPHVQHIYRNVMQPVLRHVPKPVEVPLTHYKPIPVERIVDRNVPIPVELEVVQEFLCPKIVAKYVEVPVPIPVTRTIEKPVPADAMFNSVIMDAYMTGQAPTINKCTQFCGTEPAVAPAIRMTSPQLKEAGLTAQPSFSHVKTFKSRGAGYDGFNISRSEDFLTQQRTLLGRINK